MPSLQVDVAHDCDHDTLTKEFAQRHGCEVTLLQENGPAGGNPLYEFTGTSEALASLSKDWYEGGEHQVLYIEE